MNIKQKIQTCPNLFRTILTALGIFLSFYITDFGLRYIITKEVAYYELFKISPNFFTISWIILLGSILTLIKPKYRKMVYLLTLIINNLYTYFEYLLYQKDGTLSSLFKVWTDEFLNLVSYTDLKIVIICGISIFISILTCHYGMKKEETSRTNYQILVIILLTIIFFGGLRGIAVMSLGKEVITTSKKIEEVPKNIYLYEVDQNKKIEVSGTYEYLYLQIKDYCFEQFNKNQEKIKVMY